MLPVLVLASSFVPGLFIFLLPESRTVLRSALNLAGAVVKLALIVVMLAGVAAGQDYEFRYRMLPGLDLVLRADALALLFVTLSASLWLLTTLYAIGYLEDAPNRSRFFGFFSLCVTSTVGIAMAGNLLTFFVFYEMLTLSTYPLVVHRGTPDALRAGSIYLAYTLGGGAVFLVGVVWLYSLAGQVEFAHGGAIAHLAPHAAGQLRAIFALLIAGLGVKAALVPLHGWLPKAMVAPAPVSALLHAVAVVKAGAFGVVRVVYEVFGIELSQALGLLVPLAVLACVTILWGSLRALFQDDLKRRLAYSTISQVSYIVLGVALFGPVGTIGGLVHLVHQGIMKITLFFCAGNYAETLGVHRISEMNGIGRRMPVTTLAFSVAALGMMGVPLTAGQVSKHYLSEGARLAGAPWAYWVLLASSLLNAAYFLPILYRAWLKPQGPAWRRADAGPGGRPETRWLLLAPPVVSGVSVVLAALLANTAWSPLAWARLIAAREYLDNRASEAWQRSLPGPVPVVAPRLAGTSSRMWPIPQRQAAHAETKTSGSTQRKVTPSSGGKVKKFLVPCDGSDNALRAVRYAAAKARSAGPAAQVDLLHVMAPYYAVSFDEPLAADDLDPRFPTAAAGALRGAADILRQAGVSHRLCCRWGQTEAREILAHAASHHCDAIIMGTRGRNPLATLVMGSVATQVVHATTIPVTLVK